MARRRVEPATLATFAECLVCGFTTSQRATLLAWDQLGLRCPTGEHESGGIVFWQHYDGTTHLLGVA